MKYRGRQWYQRPRASLTSGKRVKLRLKGETVVGTLVGNTFTPGKPKRVGTRLDPTGTIQLRLALHRELKSRFKALADELHQIVIVEDAFGLNRPSRGAPGPFSFIGNEQAREPAGTSKGGQFASTHGGGGFSYPAGYTPPKSLSLASVKGGTIPVGPNPNVPAATRPALTAPEAKAITAYTDVNVYRPLNESLKAGETPKKKGALARLLGADDPGGVHEKLQQAFDKAPVLDKPVVVKRGINPRKTEELAQFFTERAGTVVKLPGYQSTSAFKAPEGEDPFHSAGGGYKGTIKFTIHAVHALDVRPYSKFPDEDEILLPHNSEYHVGRVERRGGELHVELHQLPPKKTITHNQGDYDASGQVHWGRDGRGGDSSGEPHAATVNTGAGAGNGPVTRNTRWHGLEVLQQVRAFNEWFKSTVSRHLRPLGDRSYWAGHMEAGFDHGAGRSYDDVTALTPHVAALEGMKQLIVNATRNVFCPTGEGGGVNPHCSKGGESEHFHGTAEEHLKAIFKDGIVAGKTKQWPDHYYDGERANSVYVTRASGINKSGDPREDPAFTVAANYAKAAARRSDGDGVVLILKVPTGVKFHEDEREPGFAFRTAEKIKPEWIAGYVKISRSPWEPPGEIEKPPTANSADITYFVAIVLPKTRKGLTDNALPLPVPKTKFQALLHQSFTELDGVTEEMAKKMSRLVTNAILQNTPPKELAGQLAKQVDITMGRAQTIARTELIKAHAEGQLTALEQMGIDEVEQLVEWSTADHGLKGKKPKGGHRTKRGNLSPCPLCAPMKGVVFNVADAHGLIPRHPNCVCAWIPVAGQKKYSSKKQDSAVEKSQQLGGDEWGNSLNAMLVVHPAIDVLGLYENSFCPTGPGGGVDPTCSPGSESSVLRGDAILAARKDKSMFPPGHMEMYRYHATSINNLSSIQSEGLKATGLLGREPRVSFGAVSSEHVGANSAILRTANSGLKTDPVATESYRYSTEGVPPHKLEVLTKDGWKPIHSIVLPKTHAVHNDLTENRTYVRDKEGRFATVGSGGQRISKELAHGSIEGLPHPNHVHFVKALGGSTGASLVEDSLGKKWVVKHNLANQGHLKNEALADKLYTILGVPTPKSGLVHVGSTVTKMSEFQEGKTLADWSKGQNPATVEAMHREIAKHFVADALLGNWDVAGLNHDNILITKTGTPLRIDNGGALEYRAQGAKKGLSWNAHMEELKTLRDPVKNPSSAKIFSHLTDKEIHQQMAEVLAHKAAVLDAIPSDSKLHAVMNARFTTLEEKLHAATGGLSVDKGGTVPAPAPAKVQPPTPPPAPVATTPQPVSTVVGGGHLHDAQSLIEHIQSTAPLHGVKYTELVLEKMSIVNPNGVQGVVKIPASAHAKAQQEHLEKVLPPGTVIQIAMLPSFEKMKAQHAGLPIPPSKPKATPKSKAPAHTFKPLPANDPDLQPSTPIGVKGAKSLSKYPGGSLEHIGEVSMKVAHALVELHANGKVNDGIVALKAWVKEAVHNGIPHSHLQSAIQSHVIMHPDMIGKPVDLMEGMKTDLQNMYKAVKTKAPGAATPFTSVAHAAQPSIDIHQPSKKKSGLVLPKAKAHTDTQKLEPPPAKWDHQGTILKGKSAEPDLQAHSKPVIATMTKTQTNAIMSYTGSGYASLNEEMRKCPPEFKCLKDKYKERYENIKSGLEKAPPLPNPTVTKRGIHLSGSTLKEFIATLTDLHQKSEPYQMPSFASSSIDRPFSGNVKFEVLAKNGVYVKSISSVPHENEILLSPHQKFKIHHVMTAPSPYGGSDQVHIRLEEI